MFSTQKFGRIANNHIEYGETDTSQISLYDFHITNENLAVIWKHIIIIKMLLYRQCEVSVFV